MDSSIDNLLMQFFIPINIGLAALLYPFAFTFFKNLLYELHEISNKLKQDNGELNKEQRKWSHNVVQYYRSGKTIMNIIFLWSAISFLFGVVCVTLLFFQSNWEFWIIVLKSILGFLLCGPAVYLLFRDQRNTDISLYVVGVSILPIIFPFSVIFWLKCINSLSYVLVGMLIGLTYYMLEWFTLSIIYSPLRSLLRLRGML